MTDASRARHVAMRVCNFCKTIYYVLDRLDDPLFCSDECDLAYKNGLDAQVNRR